MNLVRWTLALGIICAISDAASGQVTCSISEVEYRDGMMDARAAVFNEAIGLPAIAADNPIKIFGQYTPKTNPETATVSVSIVEWDPNTESEVAGTTRNLTETLGGAAPNGVWWTGGVTVERGKVYKIKASTTHQGQTVHADDVTLNVANN